MFQFTGLAPRPKAWWHAFNMPGCPIRKSPDRRLFAPPRSLSQLITSFFASESQGIRRTLLVTFLTYYLTICSRISKICNSYFLSICQWTLVNKKTNLKPALLFLWRISESNRWPLECKSSALANWANPPSSIRVRKQEAGIKTLLILLLVSLFLFLKMVVPRRFELRTPTLSV